MIQRTAAQKTSTVVAADVRVDVSVVVASVLLIALVLILSPGAAWLHSI